MTKFSNKVLRNSCFALYIMVNKRSEVTWAVRVARI